MAKVSSLPVVVLDYIYVFLLLVPVSILSNTIFLLFFILLRFVRFIANLSPVCKRDHSERYVIVTGCDTGFGYEIVLKLAKSGFHVFAGCFTSEGVKQFQANCKSEENGSTSVTIDTEKITSFLLDVTSDESVAQAKILVTSKLPPNKGIWALVNNAGIGGPYIPDDWATINDYISLMDVNFFGAVRVTHAFKGLVKAERGRLVFMSSIFGHCHTGAAAPYVAAKHALVGYCETLRLELDDYGVKVSQIVPGFHKTHFADPVQVSKLFMSRYDKLDDRVKLEYPRDSFLPKRVQCILQLIHELTMLNSVKNVIDATVESISSRWPENLYWVGMEAQLHFRTLKRLPSEVTLWQTRANRLRLRDGYAGLSLLSDNTTQNRSEITTL